MTLMSDAEKIERAAKLSPIIEQIVQLITKLEASKKSCKTVKDVAALQNQIIGMRTVIALMKETKQ